MANYNECKNICLERDDWKKFFVNAYRTRYEKVLIGIVKRKSIDIYTGGVKNAPKEAEDLLFELNLIDKKITYEELAEKVEDKDVKFVYLHIEVEGVIVGFNVYNVKGNEIVCDFENIDEYFKAMRVCFEIDSLND